MKKIEWKLLSELMKNSQRSDRELAKAIGSSQPTVSRNRKNLEEKGYIRQYTMIPDFSKIGYKILAFTFVKLKSVLDPEGIEKARVTARKALSEDHFEVVMLERGIGLGYDGIIVSFHADYDSYVDFRDYLRKFDFLETTSIESFLVNLKDEIRYRPLDFRTLAQHLLTLKECNRNK